MGQVMVETGRSVVKMRRRLLIGRAWEELIECSASRIQVQDRSLWTAL